MVQRIIRCIQFSCKLILGIGLCTYYAILDAQTYEPGNRYLDSQGYVEYVAGNLPLILVVPHGGHLTPDSIPDRACSGCLTINDAYTQELARELFEELVEQTGCHPHLVINLMHRRKFDANRDIGDAADGNLHIERAWHAFHDFIEISKTQVVIEYGHGIVFDLHGHGHPIQRLELGYLLSKPILQLPNDSLNKGSYQHQSSVRSLALNHSHGLRFAEILRGPHSMGALFELQNYSVVPSSVSPFPLDDEPYFSGGYNTRRHGSIQDGSIDAIQIECNRNVRFNEDDRRIFKDSLARTMIRFIDFHYGPKANTEFCSNTTSTKESRNLSNLIIFPNPASQRIRVRTDLEYDLVQIHNVFGYRLLTTNKRKSGLDISGLPDGLYFVQLIYNGQIVRSSTFMKGN